MQNHIDANKARSRSKYWNSGYRNPKKTMYSWKTKLSLGEILKTDNMCKVPMKMLNYSLVGSLLNLSLINYGSIKW